MIAKCNQKLWEETFFPVGLINRVYHWSGRLHKSRDICTPVRRNYLQGPIHWEISFIEYVSEQAIMPGRKSPLGVTESHRIKALLLTLNFEKNILRPPPPRLRPSCSRSSLLFTRRTRKMNAISSRFSITTPRNFRFLGIGPLKNYFQVFKFLHFKTGSRETN